MPQNVFGVLLIEIGSGRPSSFQMQTRLDLKNVCFLGKFDETIATNVHRLAYIASKFGGMLETIPDGVTGYYVTPGNAAELSGFCVNCWEIMTYVPK